MSAAEAVKQRLRADLKAAMQAKDAVQTSVIRSLMAAIDNAQAVPVDLSGPASAQRAFGDGTGEVARLAFDPEAVRRLIAQEAEARIAAAQEMARFGRDEDAARLQAEAEIARRYLV